MRFPTASPIDLVRFAGLFAILLLVSCGPSEPDGVYQGYIEGEYVYVASPEGGALRELAVSRGDQVEKGQALFALDPEPEASTVEEAARQLAKAEALLADAKKGRRPSEIEALEAQKTGAETELKLAELTLKRREELVDARIGAIAEEELEQTRSKVAGLRAQAEKLAADLKTAKLGSRENQIEASAADVSAAQAAKERADWALAQKKQAAPADSAVHDTLYRPGEWVGPGKPVVVLLPPDNIKVRFFVPQADLEILPPGREVGVTFDGAPHPFTARVNYVSTQAEFTPPVIYSEATRKKLVFMIEAVFPPEDAARLRPGQPVSVTPQP